MSSANVTQGKIGYKDYINGHNFVIISFELKRNLQCNGGGSLLKFYIAYIFVSKHLNHSNADWLDFLVLITNASGSLNSWHQQDYL